MSFFFDNETPHTGAQKQIHANSAAALREHKASGRAEIFRRAIFDLFQGAGGALTDREVIELLREPDVNNVRPEITRLKQDGLLIEVGKTVCARTGKKVRRSQVAPNAVYAARNTRGKRAA